LPQIIGTQNFYLDLSKNETNKYYADEKWDFEEALKDAKKDSSIIEIGCGPGNFLEKVKPYVAYVCGTEHNEHALRIARSKGLKVFGKDDYMSGNRAQFDAAFSFHVLEHAANPVVFLQELCSWVKPGGKVGVSVPNQDGPIKYIDPCVQNMPPHHATRWHLRTFELVAKKLGLKIERVAYEPLIARDHYYYSTYWLNHVIPEQILQNSSLNRIFHKMLSGSFRIIFSMLSRFNRDSLGLLNGQAIYVLMSVIKRNHT
jgi:SAM-dependent methyltransferase